MAVADSSQSRYRTLGSPRFVSHWIDMSSLSSPQIFADYDGGCIANVVPALFGLRDDSFVPHDGRGADHTVLLVLDGLGVDQFEANRECMPTLAGLAYNTITSVVPSTTASALTSISTGVATPTA